MAVSRTWPIVAVAAVFVIVVVAIGHSRRSARDEARSVSHTKAKVGVPPEIPSMQPPLDSASPAPQQTTGSETIASLDSYPADLDALRARLPGNRYWELGAPTSDPAVAKARAERARRDNIALGRIQSGEASPDEIRAYYAERRAISRDFLQFSELVIAEHGDALPPRDRGMFELSVNLHRARLTQIDRDESDALARRGVR